MEHRISLHPPAEYLTHCPSSLGSGSEPSCHPSRKVISVPSYQIQVFRHDVHTRAVTPRHVLGAPPATKPIQ